MLFEHMFLSGCACLSSAEFASKKGSYPLVRILLFFEDNNGHSSALCYGLQGIRARPCFGIRLVFNPLVKV